MDDTRNQLRQIIELVGWLKAQLQEIQQAEDLTTAKVKAEQALVKIIQAEHQGQAPGNR